VGQAEQAATPPGEYDPAAHKTQIPEFNPYPDLHSVANPVIGSHLDALLSQGVHAEAPAAFAKVKGSHGRQAVGVTWEYVPARHCVHAEDPEELVANPGGHFWQYLQLKLE